MGPITIQSFELEVEVTNAVEEVIEEQGWDDVHVEREMANKGFRITEINGTELSPFSRSDITIFQKRDWSPPELDQIENISRWFPDKRLDIPLVELEIKNKPQLSDSFRNLNFSTDGHVLQGVIHAGSLREAGMEVLDDGSSFIFRVNDIDDLYDSNFANLIRSHIEAQEVGDIYSDAELREKISNFKPEVFHFNEVINAYKNNRTKVLIILLAVFFQGYIEDLISDAMEEARENDKAGDIYDSWGFKESLNACRYFGLISENEYRVIDQIRIERNVYAHEHEKYHPDIESEVSESGTLREAIELYEEIIGVEDSMLND